MARKKKVAETVSADTTESFEAAVENMPPVAVASEDDAAIASAISAAEVGDDLNDDFLDALASVGEIIDTSAMDDEFRAVVKKRGGRISLPTDAANKDQWYVNLVCECAEAGMSYNAIVKNIAKLSCVVGGKREPLGVKRAAAMCQRVKTHVRNKMIFQCFNGCTGDEKERRKIAAAFWSVGGKGEKVLTGKDGKKLPPIRMVKIADGQLPIAVALNMPDCRASWKLIGEMAATRKARIEKNGEIKDLLPIEKADVEKAKKIIMENDRSLNDYKAEINTELKKYFHIEGTRGRGSNSSIMAVSEITFDVFED